jgi:hypothetical protein
MARAGSAHPADPTTFAGTPATVTFFGTSDRTTEPAAMREQRPHQKHVTTIAQAFRRVAAGR